MTPDNPSGIPNSENSHQGIPDIAAAVRKQLEYRQYLSDCKQRMPIPGNPGPMSFQDWDSFQTKVVEPITKAGILPKDPK